MYVKIRSFAENNSSKPSGGDVISTITCKSMTFRLVTKTTQGASSCFQETRADGTYYLVAKSSSVTLPAKEPIYKLPTEGQIRHCEVYSYWNFPDKDFRWGKFDSITDDERLVTWVTLVLEDMVNNVTYTSSQFSSIHVNYDLAYSVQGIDFMTSDQIDRLKLDLILTKVDEINNTISNLSDGDEESTSDKFFNGLDLALGVGTGAGTALLISMIINMNKNIKKMANKIAANNSSHGS